jgi:hypothetical protein
MIILVAISLSAIDIITAARRLLAFAKTPNKTFKTFWRYILNKEVEDIKISEYHALIPNESDNYSTRKVAHDSDELDDVEQYNTMNAHEAGQWANRIHRHRRQHSIRQKILSSRALSLVGHSAFLVVERFLIFAGFAQLLLGIVTYTGKACISTSPEIPFTFLQEDVEKITGMAA